MTMRRFELLVFDWDGTLMDSAAAIVASLQAACHDLGHPVPTDAQARYIIGLGLHDAIRHVLPQIEPAEYPQLLERYRAHYLLRDADIGLFDGAGRLVDELKEAGFTLAVATGKSRRGLDRALAATGLAGCFHATRCADEGHPKPHPGMLESLMRALEVAPEKTLMIGDTTHDMAMAQNARVARVAVTYGAHPRGELEIFGPLACIDAVSDLRAWLMAYAA
jgi:phosphoglycolate phosphatase